jgi:WD40 repeat protein
MGHAGNITSVDWNSDGGLLVSSAMDGTTRLWDTETGATLAKWPWAGRNVVCSADGAELPRRIRPVRLQSSAVCGRRIFVANCEYRIPISTNAALQVHGAWNSHPTEIYSSRATLSVFSHSTQQAENPLAINRPITAGPLSSPTP